MITDQQTNTVFFSNVTAEEYPNELNSLINLIKEEGFDARLLIGTEDFFCRDFMPVQVSENDFVQFVFKPEAYLKGEQMAYLTDPIYVQLITPGLIKPRYSPIILDGGNIIKGKNKVIVTERVLKDNRYQFESDKAIIDRLEFDTKHKVIIIPEFPEEETGHADGLIRFVDDNTVFINEPASDNQDWEIHIRKVLTNNDLKFIELPCPVEPNMNSAEGLYLNYLHVGNLIVVPRFDLDEDQKALKIITDGFPNQKVVPFKANWIAKEGGVLNCMSWNIKA